MNDTQKDSFTRETRRIAHNLLDSLEREECSVVHTERCVTELIQGLQKAHVDNSTEYEVKAKTVKNFFHEPEVIKERDEYQRGFSFERLNPLLFF